MGGGGEFRLLASMIGEAPLPSGVLVGPGDDAAVLSGGVVATIDLSIEGVHFRRDWLRPEELGWRAAMASLSDLAAMAAEPAGVLLSLALPHAEMETLGPAIQAGAEAAARAVGTSVVGGDLSRSPGPIVVDVAALGHADAPALRAGALPGDELWVTGHLGGSAAAVALLLNGGAPPPPLREAFVRPRARVREAIWLREEGAIHALIDLSDGLSGDAGHIAAASGVRIRIDPRRLPLHPALAMPHVSDPVACALQGGEDYELCLAAPPGRIDGRRAEAFRERFGIPLTRVGHVEAGEGVWLDPAPGGGEAIPAPGGHDHLNGGG